MTAAELLRAGKLADALKALENEVRAAPSVAKHRVFLFQLLCIIGQWDRALTQLNVAADLDPANLLMAQVCRQALACEALRAEIFAGKRTPLILGEPQQWVGSMVQACEHDATGEHAAAAALRASALEAAPAVPGTVDDLPFEWIADADERLGPIVEAIIDGRYYWIPFQNIKTLALDAPADLRDLVWTPATFMWANGGEAVGLIPARYPGSEASPDDAIRLARRTDWSQGPGPVCGLGQRLFATDAGEYPILQVRRISLGQPA
ncbi:MAG: virulence protein SciE type [Phycisphaerae bacterium]|nr:virulence protein SciE type [Phycisphaerae bacterium]